MTKAEILAMKAAKRAKYEKRRARSSMAERLPLEQKDVSSSLTGRATRFLRHIELTRAKPAPISRSDAKRFMTSLPLPEPELPK